MNGAPVVLWVSVLIVVVVAIWLVSGGAVPFYKAQPAGVEPLSAAPSADTENTSKEAKAVKPSKQQKSSKTTPVAEVASEPLIPAPVVEAVPSRVAPVAPVVSKQFPSAREISIGAPRENISEKFGEPALATITTSADGRMMETLVYARKSGRDMTVIRMEDGKVLSAYSR